MTEELRDVLLERFASVYSGYGATDIEIGMAGESPVSIAAPPPGPGAAGHPPRPVRDRRRACRWSSSTTRSSTSWRSTTVGEVVCTVSRLDLLAPRIRYNVHDEGGRGRLRAASSGSWPGSASTSIGSVTRPRSHGPRGPLPWARPIPLPFLWIHGRRDATISVMGSNIYPEDIEAVLYRDPRRRAAAALVHAVGGRRRDGHAAARRSPSSSPTSTASTTPGGPRPPSASATGWRR